MIEHLENPQALTALFGDDFYLGDVSLHEVVIHRDGPSLRLRFDVQTVPRIKPARWPAEANTTQVVLHASPIEQLQVCGFTTCCAGVLRAKEDGGTKLMEFNGSGCTLKFTFSWLRVESVSGYINAEDHA